jgi:hypothetical protein
MQNFWRRNRGCGSLLSGFLGQTDSFFGTGWRFEKLAKLPRQAQNLNRPFQKGGHFLLKFTFFIWPFLFFKEI